MIGYGCMIFYLVFFVILVGSGPAHIHTKKSIDHKVEKMTETLKKVYYNNLCRDHIYVKASQ